jgi:hypothetical protein
LFASDYSQGTHRIAGTLLVKSPEDTYEALIDLHGLFSDITRHLIQDDKAVKIERDRGEGAEQVIYIFARAVQRQMP